MWTTHWASSASWPWILTAARGAMHRLPFIGEEAEAEEKPWASPAPQPGTGRKCQDPVQTCLPPMSLFSPPHQANPLEADTAERKVTTRWQGSRICSSCTTGKPSVMTQSSLPDLHTEPCPHSTWAFPATCGACAGRQSRGLSSSVGVGGK